MSDLVKFGTGTYKVWHWKALINATFWKPMKIRDGKSGTGLQWHDIKWDTALPYEIGQCFIWRKVYNIQYE